MSSKKKELKFLSLENKKLVGGIVEEHETFYAVEGCYIYLQMEENLNPKFKDVKHKGRVSYEPFSPVGGLIQKLNIPKDKVVGFLELSNQFKTNFEFILKSEIKNKRRKEYLLSRIPATPRPIFSPEDYLSKIAQYMEKNKKLPIKEDSMLVERDGNIVSGHFKVKKVSPYRCLVENNNEDNR